MNFNDVLYNRRHSWSLKQFSLIAYRSIPWGVTTPMVKWYKKCQPLALRLFTAFCKSSCLPPNNNCWDFGVESCQKLLPYKFPLKDNFWSVTRLLMKLFLLWKVIKLFWDKKYLSCHELCQNNIPIERKTSQRSWEWYIKKYATAVPIS